MTFIDPRKPGEALWPAKYPIEELMRRKAMLGAYDFSALYMGAPAPSGGGLFQSTWFRFVDVPPADARRVRGWDTASTENGGDWTVGVKMSELNGNFYVEDVIRVQLGPAGVDKLIETTAMLDGRGCSQREEQEGGSSGKAVVAARLKLLAGYDYASVSISGDKVTRARPFRAQVEGQNVFLVRASWNEKYINELCAFPTGRNDDQVDASSAAFNVLLQEQPVTMGVTW